MFSIYVPIFFSHSNISLRFLSNSYILGEKESNLSHIIVVIGGVFRGRSFVGISKKGLHYCKNSSLLPLGRDIYVIRFNIPILNKYMYIESQFLL